MSRLGVFSTRLTATEWGTAHPWPQLLGAAISAINTRLDDDLAQFAGRRLDEPCPYLILDARNERVREAGVIRSQAVLLAIGINLPSRLRQDLADRLTESGMVIGNHELDA